MSDIAIVHLDVALADARDALRKACGLLVSLQRTDSVAADVIRADVFAAIKATDRALLELHCVSRSIH